MTCHFLDLFNGSSAQNPTEWWNLSFFDVQGQPETFPCTLLLDLRSKQQVKGQARTKYRLVLKSHPSSGACAIDYSLLFPYHQPVLAPGSFPLMLNLLKCLRLSCLKTEPPHPNPFFSPSAVFNRLTSVPYLSFIHQSCKNTSLAQTTNGLLVLEYKGHLSV